MELITDVDLNLEENINLSDVDLSGISLEDWKHVKDVLLDSVTLILRSEQISDELRKILGKNLVNCDSYYPKR